MSSFGRIKHLVHLGVRRFVFVGAAAILLTMALNVVDIFLRSVSYLSVPGVYELVGFSGLIAVCFALSYTQVRKGHITMRLLISHIPQRVQSTLNGMWYLLSAGMCLLISWRSIVLAQELHTARETSFYLHLPLSVFIWIISFCFAIFFVVLLVDSIDSLRSKK